MTTTTKRGLPLVTAGQALASVYHNESVEILDICNGLLILDRDLTAPPGGESQGDAYIPKAVATGAWTGLEDDIVIYDNSAWVNFTPVKGMAITVDDEDRTFIYNGAAWVDITSLAVTTESGITAGVGQVQGNSPLTKDYNEISVCGNVGDAVTLPAAEAGRRIFLRNNGANQAQVFPASGDSIDGGVVDTCINLAAAAHWTFLCVLATGSGLKTWYST